MLNPPSTDQGTLPNLRFSFADAHTRQTDGGWTRQVTQREFGISTTLAGVEMRLNAGSIRELHWHKQAEWAYMLYGTARITAIDQDGNNFVDDVGVGDLWYFPGGLPHSIQGLGPDGCEFLLVFDDGYFDEDDTFLITDWFKRIPQEVLGKNFGVSGDNFAHLPDPSQRYIFKSEVPGPLGPERLMGAKPVPQTLSMGSWRKTRSAPKAEPCASPIRVYSKRRKRSPPLWSKSSRAGCANCIGIPT
jgi:oxalate decarboxylase